MRALLEREQEAGPLPNFPYVEWDVQETADGEVRWLLCAVAGVQRSWHVGARWQRAAGVRLAMPVSLLKLALLA